MSTSAECLCHCCMATSGLWPAQAGQLASPEFDILLILRAQIELTLYSGSTQDSFLETFTRSLLEWACAKIVSIDLHGLGPTTEPNPDSRHHDQGRPTQRGWWAPVAQRI